MAKIDNGSVPKRTFSPDGRFHRVLRALRVYFPYRFLCASWGIRRPITAVFKVTSRCNLRCSHCAWERERAELSTAEWEGKIDEAWNLGCVCLCLEGGEPLLRDDIQQLVDYARNKGMIVFVITNGTKDLRGISPDALVISLDGLRSTHDKIRGEGVYDRIFENIERVPTQYKVALMTISQSNVEDALETALAWSPHFDGIWYNYVYPYEGTHDLALSQEDNSRIGEQLAQQKQQFPAIANSRCYLRNRRKDVRCRPWWSYTVMADGSDGIRCTAMQVETVPDCEQCRLSCYLEPSLALDYNLESIRFIQRVSGLPRLFFYR